MKVKLKCSLLKYQGFYFLSGKGKSYRLPYPLSEESLSFINDLEQGITQEQLDIYLSSEECKNLYVFFEEFKLLASHNNVYMDTCLEKTYDFLSHYVGELGVPFEFKKELHVAIIGCGGTGSNVALCLASSGVNKFSLIDFDDVQLSNLNRQFAYDSNDVGKPKVKCLYDKLQNINRLLELNLYERKITCSSDLDILPSDVDLIVSAIDYPAVRSSIYTLEYAIQKNIPIIFGAVGYDLVSAGPLLTKPRASLAYLSFLKGLVNVAEKPISGSLSSTNLFLSSIMATNIISWFYCFTTPLLNNTKKIFNPYTLELVKEIKYDHYNCV